MTSKALSAEQVAYVKSSDKTQIALARELGVNRGTILRVIHDDYVPPKQYIPPPPGSEWRAIAGFEGKYEVSDVGDVRNVLTGKFVRQRVSMRGYWEIGLARPKPQRQKHLKVHRVVAAAFIPNPDNLPEVNHKDGLKLHNKVSNLEWKTSRDNMRHAIASGRQTALTNPNKRYKLSPEDVAYIREHYRPGDRRGQQGGILSELAARFHLNKTTILRIAKGRAWYDPALGIPPAPKSRGTRDWRRPKRKTALTEAGPTPAASDLESSPVKP